MKRLALATLATVAGAAAFAVLAGEHEGKRARVALLPQYAQECGSCHVPFAPRLLPAASWRAIVGGLDKHFGTDASLDAPTAKAIGAWLEANAGTGKRAASMPPENRITRSAWFLHEHDEIAPSTWRLPSVQKPSNCGACHAGVAQGAFDEHDVRIPR
jgi:hypothetical protein